MKRLNNKTTLMEGAGLSQYLTPMDIAGAITAGVVAYIRNKAEPTQEEPASPDSFDSVKDEFTKFQADGRATKIAGGWVCTDDQGNPVAVYKTIQGGGYEKFTLGADGQLQAGRYFAPDGSTVDLGVDHAHAVKAANSLAKWTVRKDGGGVADVAKAANAAGAGTGRLQPGSFMVGGDEDPLVKAAVKVKVGDSITVKDPSGKIFAIGRLKDGTTWRAPVIKDPDFNDYDFGQAITSDGRTVNISGFLQHKSEKLAEMGQVFNVDGTGKVTLAARAAAGFSATNLPKFSDTSPAASQFWLKNPDLAKANGITVSNVVKTANGISGTISRSGGALAGGIKMPDASQFSVGKVPIPGGTMTVVKAPNGQMFRFSDAVNRGAGFDPVKAAMQQYAKNMASKGFEARF